MKQGLLKFPLPLLSIIIMAVLTFFFHVQPEIINAVTFQPESDFAVHISHIRILIEPVIGWMLFYMGSDQPIVELCVLLAWILVMSLIVKIITGLWKKSGIWKSVKIWLLTIPYLFLFTIVLLIIIIFAPLPGNTIINQAPDTILVNTHSHSYYSHDGIISPKRLMKWHKRNGFDAFFLTEHNNHWHTLELVQQQLNGQIPDSPLILCGQEYSGSNHIALLGLTRDFRTKDMPDSTAIDSCLAQAGVPIIAHWFSEKPRPLEYYVNAGARGFEIANQAEGIQVKKEDFNAIVQTCQDHHLLMLSCCDYHGYGSVALNWNALRVQGWNNMAQDQKREAIMSVLRQQDQSLVTPLIYRDRNPFPREQVWFSPFYNLTGYFRSLNSEQFFSWLIWILVIWIVIQIPGVQQILSNQKVLTKILFFSGVSGSLIIFSTGLAFLWFSKHSGPANKIFINDSGYFIGAGIVFALFVFTTFKRIKNNVD